MAMMTPAPVGEWRRFAHTPYAGAVSSEQWGFNRRAVINKLYYARRARHVTMPISSGEETRNESIGFRESWRGDHRRLDGHRLSRGAATCGERRAGKSVGLDHSYVSVCRDGYWLSSRRVL